MRNSHYSPFLLLEAPGFSELLWAPIPGLPLRLCPGDLTAPPDPQLTRAMTFACRHDIINNPTNFWWWWFEGGGGGGSHEISTNREGDNQFFCCFQGDRKFNRVFHPVSTTRPRELKNDNSLTVIYREVTCVSLDYRHRLVVCVHFERHLPPSLWTMVLQTSESVYHLNL